MLTAIALAAAELLKKYGFETAKWIAQRAFLLALALGVGPIVLFKGFSIITRFMMNYASGSVGEVESVTVQLVGIGGWMADAIMLPEAMSVYLSFCLLSFLLHSVRVK